MPILISKTVFKSKVLEFFRQIEETGEAVVVTDHCWPCLEIRPYRPYDRNPLEVLRGSVLRCERLTDPVGEEDWSVAD